MSKNLYGTRRVLEPPHVLPTSAWRVDNSRAIAPDEMRVSIRRVHVESTSFKQVCLEAGNKEEQIKEKLRDITILRGKLHNPTTDTGGLLYGVIEEIGTDYPNPKGLVCGEEIICNASLACIPMYISQITKIDRAYSQFEAEGYAIIYVKIPVVRKPEDLPMDLLLFAFNESGTLYRVSNEVRGKSRVLVVGNNMIMNILFGHAARKALGKEGEIHCLFDKNTDLILKGKSVDALLSSIFTQVHYLDILKPMECLERLHADSYFDVSINCADIPGAETINVLATRSGGAVFFANLISNYNIALYITESVSRQLDIRCADGYLEEYDAFDIELVEELAGYLEGATINHGEGEPESMYPFSREELLYQSSGHRKAIIEEFVWDSAAMSLAIDETIRVAKYDCNVLISGETGVGKEKIASLIQKNSTRNMHPFIKINCASIAPTLLESELFGYEKGAFTGASHSGKKGYFELADNGTLLLDEIGELPMDFQAKLLRVLQDGEFFRVGGSIPIKTNVRILSATNRNLEDMVEKKLFRRDLYYRLNVFPIKVPSLSERREDIAVLARFFLEGYGEKFGMKKGIDQEAIAYLQQLEWPGNIRQLENMIQRLMIAAKGANITLFDVMRELHPEAYGGVHPDLIGQGADSGMNLEELVGSFEKQILKYACEKHGSTRKTAKAMGISQTQLVRKKKKYDLP